MSLRAKELAVEVRRLAEENPNYKYTEDPRYKGSCSYIEPPCIVGQAAMNLGMSAEELRKYEDQFAMSLVEDGVSAPANWLCEVQALQDAGNTWAEAVEGADTYWKG